MSVAEPVARRFVLHVGPTPFFSDRGCHIRIAGLMRALAAQGIGGALCTYHHGRDVAGIETLRIPTVPGYRRRTAGPAGLKYAADVLLFLRVLTATLRRCPDLLHGHLHEGALIAWAVSRLIFWRRIPVVFDVQGSLTGELEQYDYIGRAGWRRRLFERLERFVDTRADALACSSSSALEIARDRFGVAPERLFEVPDGVDVEIAPAAASRQVRYDLGIPSDVVVVVYSGSLLPVKGLEVLHEVIRRCARDAVGVRFLLVGYPVESTEEFLAREGIAASCTLTGQLPFENLAAHLGAADIAIEPKAAASGEASGKLLNYMAAGLPVVAFETANNRSMLGDAGCYASSGSAAALVDAIRTLSQSPDQRRDIGDRARERAAVRFSWQISVQRLVQIYRGLLVA